MPKPATIAETLKLASGVLRDASISNDVLDAQTLLAEAIGRDRTYLIINFNRELSEEELAKFRRLIERRASGEPLQYIVGRQEFFGLEFEVNPSVLIPRPETELIIEEAIRLAHDLPAPKIVDVGTGSGCIAVTLARELSRSRVIASDVSLDALAVAKRNATRNGVEARIDFVATDLLEALAEAPFADFIISNPPYVSEKEMTTLQREVRDWEPRIALTDFGDGLSFYRRLLKDSASRLAPGGYFLCEMGYSQSGAIMEMVDENLWEDARLLDDLQGIPRILTVKRGKITKQTE